MLHFLSAAVRSREWLIRQLELDVRGFYRDLEFLRGVGIPITLDGKGYRLDDGIDDAVARLPFPDPHLTLGEVRQLARGRSRIHLRLRNEIKQLLS
jgi:predicted DNA-binding transcriptional regulator YafY